eukprot:scaffold18161_cov59-Cyclotella_meneghiniana.AAC.3
MEGIGMVLTDAKGSVSWIKMLSSSGTNKGLIGYFQAVDANQKVEYEESGWERLRRYVVRLIAPESTQRRNNCSNVDF